LSPVSRVLLLTDRASRIAITIGKDAVPAVIIGEESSEPLVAELPAGALIDDGAPVSTAADGAELPHGLQVGTLHARNGVWRIDLRARLHGQDVVSVLLADPREVASKR
jgi:hypothetical protein